MIYRFAKKIDLFAGRIDAITIVVDFVVGAVCGAFVDPLALLCVWHHAFV